MKKKSISIYTILISSVFAFAIIFFSVKMYDEYKTGSSRALKSFDVLVRNFKDAPDALDELDLLTKSGEYAAITISKDGKCVFSYPNDEAQNAESTKFIEVSKTTITRGEDIFDIIAAVYIVRPAEIFYYGKISFIIILCATLFTIFLIIFYSATDKTSSTEKYSDDEEDSNDEDLETTENASDENEEIATEEEYVEDENQEYIDENEENVSDEEEYADDENQEYIDENEEEVYDEEQTESVETEETNEVPHNNEAQEIFSPTTGFCCQNHLLTRLDTELVRCGSSEMDLSLFILKLNGLSHTDEIIPQITEYLLSQVQFRDRIFEYNDDSFAIIISDMTITQAEDYAENLYNGIIAILDEAGLEEADCFIGISARTTRVISSSRLINEAEEALVHAINDGASKIIGFHVDIEKYRQYLKTNGE